MKLVASMMVRNELGRYLKPCLESLLEFCDEIRILDDFSDEPGWPHDLNGLGRNVVAKRTTRPLFFEHEGRARNMLLQWTLEGNPTHVLSVDADEFIAGGDLLRQACIEDQGPGSWSLTIEEVWKADKGGLWVRYDGGWRPHQIPILWRAPDERQAQTGAWQIMDRALACGREPLAVRRLRPVQTAASVLHFGWTNVAARQARYQRYVTHDNGHYHASQHLRSIMWPDRKIRMRHRGWPPGLDQRAILERVQA